MFIFNFICKYLLVILLLKVHEISGKVNIKQGNYTVVVATDCTSEELQEIDDESKASGTCLVASAVHGVCGYVFNDFREGFVVQDSDGETYTEVCIHHHHNVNCTVS